MITTRCGAQLRATRSRHADHAPRGQWVLPQRADGMVRGQRVDYVFGLLKNSRLLALIADELAAAKAPCTTDVPNGARRRQGGAFRHRRRQQEQLARRRHLAADRHRRGARAA